MNIRELLTDRFTAALAAAGAADAPALVQPSSKPELGDYQANGVMGAAKRQRVNPRELAAAVVAAAQIDDLADPPEIAGPGFINVRLSTPFLQGALHDAELIAASAHPQTVVVDYSSPNLAKEMHVGHLRSTIIGDAVARVLAALGHRVIRQNHVGDWGTQFGMLLTYLEEHGDNTQELADLEDFYRAAKKKFDEDADFAQRSRQTVVALQAGDPQATAQWRRFINISLSHCQETYDRLGTTLGMGDVMAESAYNDELAAVVVALDEQGLLVESDGAQCVFLDEFKAKDGSVQPIIVVKSDGGYLYATTDLAAVRHRSGRLAADRVLYFTDARQSLHFRQIYTLARKAGFASERISLEHHPFGNMLGKDGRPFQTREGGVVKLKELLDEAQSRAFALVTQKSPELPDAERHDIARAVGIGAVKYADLSKNRTSDYIFDWDQMLSFDGNTAPYLQYAYSRIQSIFRRGAVAAETLAGDFDLGAPSARTLAVHLLRFQEVLEQVAADGYPHYLCGYLYDLATAFMRFYEACPILTADEPARAGRLQLCSRTAITLKEGLALLGIDTVERM